MPSSLIHARRNGEVKWRICPRGNLRRRNPVQMSVAIEVVRSIAVPINLHLAGDGIPDTVLQNDGLQKPLVTVDVIFRELHWNLNPLPQT